MIHDPATQTFKIPNDGPPPSFLERQWKEITALIGIVLLAPIMLVYKSCEKVKDWQDDRNYTFRNKCLNRHQLPYWYAKLVLMGRTRYKLWCESYFFRSLLKQHGQNPFGNKCQMEIVEPTKPLKEGIQPWWVIFYTKDASNLSWDAVRLSILFTLSLKGRMLGRKPGK